MQRIKLLASGLLTLAVFGSWLPTSAVSPEELFLRQISGYRNWTRVTPEILKEVPSISLSDLSGAG